MRSSGPRSELCYVCGRPCLINSYDRHVSQCRELFEKREAQKDPRERRACPIDPRNYAADRNLQGKSKKFQQQNATTMDIQNQSNARRNLIPEDSYSSRPIVGRSKSGRGSIYNTANDRNDQVPTGPLTPCPECGRKFNDTAYAK